MIRHSHIHYLIALVLVLALVAFVAPAKAVANDMLDSFEPVPVATPPHATSRLHVDDDAVAPLTIETPEGGRLYYVKLQSLPGCNTLTQSIQPDFVVHDCDVFDILIHGGKQVKVFVPLGEYLIKYGSGSKWYGYQYLFGKRGTYSAAEQSMEFTREGDQLKGFILKLYKVVDGNLRTEKLRWADF